MAQKFPIIASPERTKSRVGDSTNKWVLVVIEGLQCLPQLCSFHFGAIHIPPST